MQDCWILRIITLIVFWLLMPGGVPAQENNPTVFIHANLIPMTSETILQDYTVVVHGKQIIDVGPGNQTAVPQNAKVIDCKDKYLMPGLADMHMHLRYNWMSDAWPVSPLKLYLANGVTTIRCFGPLGKSGMYALKWRDQVEKGLLIGPRIITCGPILWGYLKNPENAVIKQK
jgi:hypothetical protein